MFLYQYTSIFFLLVQNGNVFASLETVRVHLPQTASFSIFLDLLRNWLEGRCIFSRMFTSWWTLVMITMVLIIKSTHELLRKICTFLLFHYDSFSFHTGKIVPVLDRQTKKKELIFFAESCLSCQITLHGESYPQLYTINTGKISFQI